MPFGFSKILAQPHLRSFACFLRERYVFEERKACLPVAVRAGPYLPLSRPTFLGGVFAIHDGEIPQIWRGETISNAEVFSPPTHPTSLVGWRCDISRHNRKAKDRLPSLHHSLSHNVIFLKNLQEKTTVGVNGREA